MEKEQRIIQETLYNALSWFGTLPEPQGDVMERYHRWEDLGELALRIYCALAAKKPYPTHPSAWHG